MISGSAGGHKLKTLKGSLTRPTSDRVKEALFNIISVRIPGARALDLFAGSGGLGIEALSRGAETVVFVEKNPAAVAVIKENLQRTNLWDRSEVINADAMEALAALEKHGRKFDLIFMDPPYGKKLIDGALNKVEKSDIIGEGALIAAEHDVDDRLPESVGRLKAVRQARYGDTVLSFFKASSDENQ